MLRYRVVTLLWMMTVLGLGLCTIRLYYANYVLREQYRADQYELEFWRGAWYRGQKPITQTMPKGILDKIAEDYQFFPEE